MTCEINNCVNTTYDTYGALGEVVQQTYSDTTCNGWLFVTDDKGLDEVLTVDNRLGYFGSKSSIEAFFGISSEAAKMAKTAFGETGLAPFVTVAYWDKEGGETIEDALNAINACSSCWRFFTVTHYDILGEEIFDDGVTNETAAAWAFENGKLFHAFSADDAAKTRGAPWQAFDRSSAEALNTVWHWHSGTCYKTGEVDPETGEAITDIEYPYIDVAYASYQAAKDFTSTSYEMSRAPRGYTWATIPAVTGLTELEITAITGRILPSSELDPSADTVGNVYIRQGEAGKISLYPGNMGSGEFADKRHFDLFVSRAMKVTRENVLNNTAVTPFDNSMQILMGSAIEGVFSSIISANFSGFPIQYDEYQNTTRIAGVETSPYYARQTNYDSLTGSDVANGIGGQIEICWLYRGTTLSTAISQCILASSNA